MSIVRSRADSAADQLRNLLDRGTVLAASCYDGLSAAVLVEAGFSCVTISGAGVAASLVGVPDIGLVTQTEMVGVASRIVRRTTVPVIADIDTGFGGAVNVRRTIEEFVDAGVAAVHLEDQVFPKRCGHLAGKDVVPTGEFVEKICAAVSARQDSGLVVIARTDAIAVNGLDDAIDRVSRALDAGADVAFVEAPTSRSQVQEIAQRVPGHKMFNMTTGGRSPALPVDDLEQLGFNLVVIPTVCIYPAIAAMRDAARAVLASRSDEPLQRLGLSPMDVFDLVGMREWDEFQTGLAGE